MSTLGVSRVKTRDDVVWVVFCGVVLHTLCCGGGPLGRTQPVLDSGTVLWCRRARVFMYLFLPFFSTPGSPARRDTRRPRGVWKQGRSVGNDASPLARVRRPARRSQ